MILTPNLWVNNYRIGCKYSNLPMTLTLDILRRYCEFGDHRSGSAADHQTAAWLTQLLKTLGAEVEQHSFNFSQFVGRAKLENTETTVEPLFYSATGSFYCDNPLVTPIAFDQHHHPDDVEHSLRHIVETAQRQGKSAAIVPTICPNEGLCAINRTEKEVLNFPICLTPGRALTALLDETPAMVFEAKLAEGKADNIVATFNRHQNVAPLVLTTSYSGWFTCAGERGTGLAIAISLAAKIASKIPVILVLTSGHELGYLGIQNLLKNWVHPLRGVFHIGSCAADKSAYVLSHNSWKTHSVQARTNLKGKGLASISQPLDKLGIPCEPVARPADASCWVGESEIWSQLNLPMLSVAGSSPTFHTTEDQFDAAGSAELLTAVEDQFYLCASALM